MGIRVVFCTDERGGLYFNRRRQSRDRILIQNILSLLSKGEKLHISEYSLPLFRANEENVIVRSSPLNECPNDGICFIELTDIDINDPNIDEVIIYNFCEPYPFDKSIDLNSLKQHRILIKAEEFEGSSHKKIIKEVYR